jgi:hypothetical protein
VGHLCGQDNDVHNLETDFFAHKIISANKTVESLNENCTCNTSEVAGVMLLY